MDEIVNSRFVLSIYFSIMVWTESAVIAANLKES